MNKILYFLAVSAGLVTTAYASGIDKNTAKMQAMDKITGRVSVVEVPVNGEIKFGSLSVVVRSCKTRPVEETPDNFAFVDITDTDLQGVETNVFKGWMISSSPATHALEHPIYDVWLLQCIDTAIDASQLLSEKKLAERDNLPMKNIELAQSDAESQKASIGEKHQKTNDVIKEMQSEHQESSSETNILMPNEFSFDEDEEVTDSSDNQTTSDPDTDNQNTTE